MNFVNRVVFISSSIKSWILHIKFSICCLLVYIYSFILLIYIVKRIVPIIRIIHIYNNVFNVFHAKILKIYNQYKCYWYIENAKKKYIFHFLKEMFILNCWNNKNKLFEKHFLYTLYFDWWDIERVKYIIVTFIKLEKVISYISHQCVFI